MQIGSGKVKLGALDTDVDLEMALNGLADTLQKAEPGIKVRLTLDDGRQISGAFRSVSGDAVDLDDGGGHVELARVKRLNLEFSSAPKRRRRRKPAQR